MTTTHPRVDVVTVGAGWTAGMIAYELTKDGHSVVSIEKGDAQWTHPDFAHNHDVLRYQIRKHMMYDISRETWTWRPNPGAPSLPMRRYGSFHPGQGLGGAGVHWSAMVWRFLPTDFNYRTHHIDRYGVGKLPEGNRIRDWPVSYEDLEPYYDRWEYDIGVSGQAGNVRGRIVEGGNPFEGPRERPFPLPPLQTTIPAGMFSEACREHGYTPFPQPAAILSEGYTDVSGRNRSACLYCGFCTRYGCEVDAKASALTTYIPPALDTGRYDVRTGCTVIGVETGGDGLATGVTYIDRAGREHFQPADSVILSGFVLSNVRLLLLSRSDEHPGGIGNDEGLVGTNYTYQLWKGPSVGLYPGRRFNMYMGNTATIDVIYDFNADNFDHSDLDFIGGASIMCGIGERSPLSAVDDVPQGTDAEDGRNWGSAWKRHLVDNWDSYVPINIQGESLPYEDQFLDLDPRYTDAYGRPLLRITYDFHENDYNLYRFIAQRANEILQTMGPAEIDQTDELEPYRIDEYQSTHPTGGAIMGDDPSNSVCNRYGQVWDTPNVFVTGAALYPQNPGANPTATLCALAYYTAEAMRDRYFDEPRALLT